MKKHVALMGIMGGLAVALMFNNCSPQHVADSKDGFSVAQEVSFVPCAFKDDMDLFSKTYQPFLRNTCSNCHIEGGVGKGVFASSGLLVAYNAFDLAGYEKISDFAVSGAHQPPYTGPQNQATIDLIKSQWIAGLENIASCKAGGTPDPTPTVDESKRIETMPKGINAPADGSIVTLSWTIPNDMNTVNGTVSIPDVKGAILTINVRKVIVTGKSMYEITQPKLKAVGTDVLIQSLLIKMNGKLIGNQTTFRYVDQGVRMTDADATLLSPGAMLVDGVITPYDVMAISIGKVEATTLPPKPILPVVSFEFTSVDVPETISTPTGKPTSSAQNYLYVKLFLDKPYLDGYVTASLGVVTNGYSPNQLAVNRAGVDKTDLSFDDRNLILDRWDWDYSMDSSAVVFDAGVTVATIRIKIANDQRKESDEVIPLAIRSVVNGTASDTNGKVVLTIKDDDPAPNPVIPTFSQLMKQGPSDGTGGVLFDYCYRCHNNQDDRGGYNLADYDLMINNGVLVPYDTASMMYRRMNEEIPGLRTMPLDGLLPTDKRRMVEQWILNGAKND